MVLTRRMIQKNIQGEVSCVLREIVSRVSGMKRVSFSTCEVTETRKYFVSKKMKKTPISKIRANSFRSISLLPRAPRCRTSLNESELEQLKTPILCRTTPIPLSLVWKAAEEVKKRNLKNPEYFYNHSERMNYNSSDEEDLYS